MQPPSDPRPSSRLRSHLPSSRADWVELEGDLHRFWIHGRLVEALARLPDDQREVVRLRFVDEWEVDVVAEMTGRSRGEVQRLERTALSALRSDLLGPATGPA